MEFIKTPIDGLIMARPKRFRDERGYFMETYRKEVFDTEIGDINFIQDNESESIRGTLRGLHMQINDKSQAKLVRVTNGTVFDVAVDMRQSSPTFGKWFGTELSHENGLMLFIPRGFAHGFMVLSESARFVYKVDNYYAPEAEITVSYNDPEIGVEWPRIKDKLILSERDIRQGMSFEDYKRKTFLSF